MRIRRGVNEYNALMPRDSRRLAPMSAATGTIAYQVLLADTTASSELEIKRSRFLGYARRVEDEAAARAFLAELRSTHRDARHICHAFVCGPTREIQRSSDDGEPAGTAGQPILTAILERQSPPGVSQLSDIAVAVVRYFGGVKLGAGGLVQAYSQATARTLNAAPTVTRQRMRLARLPVNHDLAARLETTLRTQGYLLRETEYGADQAVISLAIPDTEEALGQVNTRLAEWSSGSAQLLLDETDWLDV